MIDEIKEHNAQYFDAESRYLWMQRKVLSIKGILVPQYIYHNKVDPLDHSISMYEHIMQNRKQFRGKKFLDIGTCAGINNILLTKAGFEVIGLDNNTYSLNCSLYVMDINDAYYKVFLGDQNDIPKMEYDVLLINQMDYIPGFMEAIDPILTHEIERGKNVIMTNGR